MADFATGSRVMRDQVLALLLSGQKSVQASSSPPHAAPSPPPRFDAWTPGTRLGATPGPRATGAGPGLSLSPVTPDAPRLPTDTDVRLAEITAGLVAASDKERRQTDTIRKLALQLERSEIQIRELGAQGPAGQPADASSSSSSSESVRSSRQRERQRDEAPWREPARRDERDAWREPKGERDYSRRERSTRRARMRAPRREEVLEQELHHLRREKREWTRRDRASRKEARDMMKLLADIRSNAQRVLDEREGHLRVIARLHHQLYGAASPRGPPLGTPAGARGDTAEHPSAPAAHRAPAHAHAAPRTPPVHALPSPAREDDTHEHDTFPPSPLTPHRPPPHPRSPGGHLSRTGSLPDFGERAVRAAGGRANSVAGELTLPFERLDAHEEEEVARDDTYTAAHGPPSAPSDSGHGSHAEGADVENLRTGLLNLFMENRTLSEKVSVLQKSVREYERQAEASEAAASSSIVDPTATGQSSAVGMAGPQLAPAEAIRKLFELDDELGVLESVVECMEFSIDTDEAERLQHTLSTIGYDGSTPPFGGERRKEDGDDGGVRDFAGNLARLAQRVADIRSNIALKYGKWLSDFKHGEEGDESVALSAFGVSAPARTEDGVMALPKGTTLEGADDSVTIPLGARLNPVGEDETVSLPPGFTLDPQPVLDDITLTKN